MNNQLASTESEKKQFVKPEIKKIDVNGGTFPYTVENVDYSNPS